MLSFVIISSKSNQSNYNDIIHKKLINDDIYYDIHNFTNANKGFNELCKINSLTNIFILENSKEINAEQIIDMIRNNYKLNKAFIIIINLKASDIQNLKKYPFYTDIINKNDNLTEKLESDIKIILKLSENKNEFFTIIKDKLLYRIPYSDILYIEKELNGKKSIIVTKTQKFFVLKSLNELQKNMDSGFRRTHQSAIVNMENVQEIDFENNKIILKNNVECYLLSRSFKKELRGHNSKCEFQITK